MSGGNLNPFKPGSIYEQIGQGVGHAVENIAKDPLPIIMAVALTVASGGLGIGVAAAEFVGAEGAMAAAVSAGVNAAIGNAASTALNGGNVSQIATSGIIAGLSAGAAAGLSGSDLIKSVTDGMDPSTVKMIAAASGQSIGGAVSAVLQGKDPLTGAISGAVQGALTSTFSTSELGDMSQAAAKVLGSTLGAGATAALTGGNVPAAIANSAVYGSLKSSLGSAYDSFNQAQADFNKTYQDAQTKVPDLVQQAQDLLPTVQQQQQDAQTTYDKLQGYVSDYNTAKANNDSAGMTTAANAFNDLKPTYDTQLSTFNDNNSKLSDLSTQINDTKTTLTTQQQALQDAATQLKANYDTFTTKLPELEKQQAQVDATVAKLPDNYAAIYNDAVSKGQDGNTSLAAAMDPYNKNVSAAQATIANLPPSIQAKFTADLASKVDPSAAAQDAQTNYTAEVLSGLSGATGTGLTVGSGADKGITLGGTTSGLTVPTTGAGIPVDQNITDATGANLNAPGTSSTGAAIGASPGGFGLNPALPAAGSNTSGEFGLSAALPANTIMGTGLPGGGDIGVTYQLGANGQPAIDSTGQPIKASSVGLLGSTATPLFSGNLNIKAPSGSSSSAAPAAAGALGVLGAGTTATTTPASTTTASTDIKDLTPGLTKGSAFKFANEPTFTAQLTPMPQQTTNPDYATEIMSAATGGSTNTAPTTTDIVDLQPTLTAAGNRFKFVSDPTFTSSTFTPIVPGALANSQNILAAATGGSIPGYAEGQQVQMPDSPSPYLRANTVHGRGLQPFSHFGGAQFAGYQQQHFAQGGQPEGMPEGHNPQFFSEGGLNTLDNTYVKGEGDGTSDSVAAMLARGEFVIPADVVSDLGNGSNDAGAEVLDEFLKTIREHKRMADAKNLAPDSKGALAYLLDAKRKVG